MEEFQAPGSTALTDEDKLWALLSWLFWPVGLVALFMEDKKTRPFIKYNAVLSLALAVIGWVISGALAAIFIGCVTGVAWLGYVIYLGIQSYQGKWVTVPWLSNFVVKQGWAQKG